MVLIPDVSHAYFQSQGEKSSFLKAGYKVKDDTNVNTFVFYSNLNSGEIDKGQILFIKPKFFIFADYISLSFPLSIAFYSHTSTDNALGDMLYANLMMKKLVKEYEDTQEKSKSLIWDSQSLFQQRHYTDSSYNTTRRVKEYSVQATGDASAFLSLKTNTKESYRIHSYKTNVSRNKQFRSNFKSNVSSTLHKDNLNLHKTVHDDSSNGRDDDAVEKQKTIMSRALKNNPYHNTSEPFFIKFFIKLTKIIPYLITHKGEAIFYGIGLILVLSLFSSILKR